MNRNRKFACYNSTVEGIKTRLSVAPCSPTGNKPDSSPRLPRMKPPFLLAKTENTLGAPRSPKPEGKGQFVQQDLVSAGWFVKEALG